MTYVSHTNIQIKALSPSKKSHCSSAYHFPHLICPISMILLVVMAIYAFHGTAAHANDWDVRNVKVELSKEAQPIISAVKVAFDRDGFVKNIDAGIEYVKPKPGWSFALITFNLYAAEDLGYSSSFFSVFVDGKKEKRDVYLWTNAIGGDEGYQTDTEKSSVQVFAPAGQLFEQKLLVNIKEGESQKVSIRFSGKMYPLIVSEGDKSKPSNREARTEIVLTARQLAKIQSALKLKGFDPGPADGIMGAKTRNAIFGFQKAVGLQATGFLDSSTIAQIKSD